ncbi:MAG: helix-turn-helix domain-containing protein [Clostridia bacterium]|nr:helix-turn-helix domain-containing protein [Clostridia bacterium]
MKNIKEIVADNLINLRKRKGWTQEEVAQNLNYSDNTVSRWERAEICPSVETLQAISDLYNVPLEYLVKENVVKRVENNIRNQKIKAFALCAMCISFLLLAITIPYVCLKTFYNLNLWILFVWSVPAAFLIIFAFACAWKKRTFYFVMLTIFIWTFLAALYLQFLQYNLWMLFLIGAPCQLAWSVWCYVRPKKQKQKVSE